MPLIKSAIKRAKQNLVRRQRRKPFNTYMKTMIKKITDLVTAKKEKEAQGLLPKVYKAIDMAAKKSIIHKRTAARKKSFVARLVGGKK